MNNKKQIKKDVGEIVDKFRRMTPLDKIVWTLDDFKQALTDYIVRREKRTFEKVINKLFVVKSDKDWAKREMLLLKKPKKKKLGCIVKFKNGKWNLKHHVFVRNKFGQQQCKFCKFILPRKSFPQYYLSKKKLNENHCSYQFN